jgi:hypothetical protein
MTARFQPIDKLPLFACEEAIATALLGPGKYALWKQIAPLLERRGFPTIDGLMGGRYTPAIRKFFDLDYKVEGDSNQVASAPHRPADLGAWQRKKNARQD